MPTDAVMIKTEQNKQNVPAAAVAARKSEVNTCLFVFYFQQSQGCFIQVKN